MNAHIARSFPELMTADEFVAWPGDGTGRKLELVDGQVRAQDAPSDAHGTIHSNVARVLGNHLMSSLRCRVVIGGGIRPAFRKDWNYRIPDIAVTCAPNTAKGHDVPEPKLLIELLSKSNARDTWDNVRNYMTVATVAEIVLIGSERAEAFVLTRDATGVWPSNPVEAGRGGPIPLTSVGLELAFADVYWGTHLAGRSG